MAKKEMIKMAVITGAASAIKYKEEHPRASESETMSHITREMRKIIRNLEEEFGD